MKTSRFVLAALVCFPEYPSGPEETFTGLKPLGESLGVIGWLATQRRDQNNLDEWLIIAPNNQTSDFSAGMSRMQPGTDYAAMQRPKTLAITPAPID